ncbi:hypothetical protein EDB85DRAFT_1981141 [Lactarius pseudohatsudake]|nr:hypothetical protein EDB85DRAFT_1981141 [Lactarius pseudohatsudake]
MNTLRSIEAGPSSSGSQTPIPPDPPTNRDPDESRALAFQVYKEVWDEFNKWKQENCKQQLLLLQKPLPPPAAAEDALLEASNLRDGEPGEVELIYLCDSEDDIPLHPGGSTVLMCETVHLELPTDCTPHPRYESCTPAVQSILLRPGSVAGEELSILPFVPYADDPTFDAKGYLGMHTRFAWEELGDPDVEVIQFETLRRLSFGNGLSPDEIDATGVLPPLRLNNREGLIYSMTQRLTIDDLRGRLNSIFPYFAPILVASRQFCPRHAWDFPPVPPTTPRVTSDDYPEGESCGSMCFREIDDIFGEDSVEWVESDIDELQCVLEVIPDTLPCGLAILVRKPCREVYIQRQRLIPDDKVYPESAQALSSNKIVYVDEKEISYNFENYLAPGPCSHTGPCDPNNPGCTCAEESVHCSRNCRCDLTCQRRWKGCRCTRKRKADMPRSQTCAETRCPCRKKGWECDPSICECDNLTFLNSRKKWPKDKKPLPRLIASSERFYCQNSDIQRGIAAVRAFSQTIVSIVWYLTAMTSFIKEYVGELVPSDLDNREPLRDHSDLNYNFGYNPSFYLDSARVGNETRYINHGSGGKNGTANSVGETRLVFGEQRVGLWACTSKAGLVS